MAWEEDSCICLNMQLIAILSRIGVTYYSKMDYLEEIDFVKKYPDCRFYDSYGDVAVLVDKEGEFHVLYSNREVDWWNM